MADVVILTGAGASRDAGLATTLELTSLLDQVLEREGDETSLTVYRYVVGGLLKARALQGESPFEPLNVEQVFSAVDLLGQRHELEAAPFVGSWDDGVLALDREPPQADDLVTELMRSFGDSLPHGSYLGGGGLYPLRASERLNEALQNAVLDSVRPGDGFVFKVAAEQMLACLGTLLTVGESADVRYLHELLRFADEQHAVLATLNYDSALELACGDLGFEWSDGVADWMNTRRVSFPVGPIQLVKLHGSLSWSFGKLLRTPLLFGSRDKLRVDGPFLDLLLTFRAALDKAKVLLVVGYSFGDAHVNHFIDEWLARPDSHIVNVNPTRPVNVRPYDTSLRARISRGNAEYFTTIERGAAVGLEQAITAVRARLDEVAGSDRITCGFCGRTNPAGSEQCAGCGRNPETGDFPFPRSFGT